MSVRVNLLPQETRARSRAAQHRAAAAGVGALVMVLLAGAYVAQGRQLAEAEARLADEETHLAMLTAERAELAVYADLDARLAESEERVRTAMVEEISVAGVLQDVAAVTPADTGLTGLNLTLDHPAEGATPVPGEPIGTLNLTGQTVAGHAPGVERILLQLDKVADFAEPFFNASTADEDEVATFSLDVGLLPTARTDRYEAGVPGELR
jgi:hypothetical protein